MPWWKTFLAPLEGEMGRLRMAYRRTAPYEFLYGDREFFEISLDPEGFSLTTAAIERKESRHRPDGRVVSRNAGCIVSRLQAILVNVTECVYRGA